MFFLTNNVKHSQILSETYIEYGQNVSKHDISQIKLFCEKCVGFMYHMWPMLMKDKDMWYGPLGRDMPEIRNVRKLSSLNKIPRNSPKKRK